MIDYKVLEQTSRVDSPTKKDEILAKFDEYGYVVVEGLLDPDSDLKPVIDEYDEKLDQIATKLHKEGLLSSAYTQHDFEERLIRIVAESGTRVYDEFRIFFNPPSTTTPDSPIHVGPAIFGLISNPKLLDVLEYFVGPDIYMNPVNIVRIKVPERRLPKEHKLHGGLTAIWWHQDEGVYADDIADLDLVTVWLPLTDASKDMGCLQLVPGSHKGDLSIHCANPDPNRVGIPELLLGPLRHYNEMKKGDVHFHHRRIQHGSLRNLSDRLRFSFDLRYQPLSQGHGQGSSVPHDFEVPGIVLRSTTAPERVLTHWTQWRDHQEMLRELFMSVDWENNPPQNQFRDDHSYCI